MSHSIHLNTHSMSHSIHLNTHSMSHSIHLNTHSMSHSIYLNTQHVTFYPPLPIIVTVSIFTVSTFTFLTHTPNIPPLFTAIPQHVTISPIHSIGYTALLKTPHSHFWWDTLPCRYNPHWLYNTFIFIGLYTYLNPQRFTVFCTDDINSGKNFK